MSAPATNRFAEIALERFDILLVELVRTDAPYQMLRDEGFKADEIAAVRRLVLLAEAKGGDDLEQQLDGDDRAGSVTADSRMSVTGPAG